MSVRITNYAMNRFAEVGGILYGGGTLTDPGIQFTQFAPHAGLGTGTGTLSQSRTALFAEIPEPRPYTTGSYNANNNVYDPVNNYIEIKVVFTYEWRFTTAYNLTEFGAFAGQAGNNLLYHDFFRQNQSDPNSTPIVVSVVPGDVLRLQMEWYLRANWTSETTVNFVINGTTGNNGAGRHDGRVRVYLDFGLDAGTAVDNAIITLLPKALSRARLGKSLSGPQPTGRDQPPILDEAIESNSVLTEFLAYSNGTYRRDARFVWPTGQGITDAQVMVFDAGYGGFCFRFTNPSTFTKTANQTLEIIFRRTWTRI